MKKSDESVWMNIKSLLSLKIMVIMRNSLFLLFLSTLHLFANNSYSQSTRISLNLQDVSVESILDEIENQTEFFFVFNSKLVDVQRHMDIVVESQPISGILSSIFDDTNVEYIVMDRQILLSPGKYITENVASRQTRTVTGRIIDMKGIPLPGVNVTIKGTATGTITDLEGSFQINVVKPDAILVISYVGFITQEIPIGDQTTIEVILQEDILGLEEVVIVGYGSQKKINLTGAVDVVTSKAFENRPAANVGEMLQGVSPSLYIGITSDGGEPGSSNPWNIRGMGTLSGNSQPLILVDGVEMDPNELDPSSIESVSVLKDAAASAIYGARAPFGVVLITTKQGKNIKGFHLNYNNNFGFASPIRLPHFVSSLELTTAFNQACDNAGISHKFNDAQMQRIKDHANGIYVPEYDTLNPPGYIWGGRHEGNANYDWMDMYWKDYSFRQKQDISLEGSSKKTNYYISTGLYSQDGLYNYGYDNYKRYNILANVTSQVTDWARIDFKTKFSQMKTDYPVGLQEESRQYMFGSMITFWPTMPMYNWGVDKNDYVHAINNPIVRAMQDAGRDKTTSNDTWITLGTEIEPVKGWKTYVSFNYNNYSQRNQENHHPIPVYNPDGSVGNIGSSNNNYYTYNDFDYYSLFNATTSYERLMKGHYFKAMIGYEQEYKYYSRLSGYGFSGITPEVPSISTALGESGISDWMGHWATQAMFGRFSYNYNEKYLLEINARYNGSSRFAEDSRWGFFPSFSAGYNISKEEFWMPVKNVINSLKIRGSYGSLGNQNVSNYLYMEIMSIVPNMNAVIGDNRPNYAQTPDIISGSLTWEKITTTDIGFDAGFFNNRLGFTFDWFNRVTSNMLGPSVDLPLVLGTSAPEENNATLGTKGWETSLLWKDKISEFSYNVRIVLGDNQTTVLKYKNDGKLIDSWYEGKKLGEIWGYTTDGLIQSEDEEMPDQSFFYPSWGPGDMKYQDLDGNDTINNGNATLNDHGDLSVIGNTTPRYNIGISAGFNWKGLDFNMFWQGVGKRDFYPPLDIWNANTNEVYRGEIFWGIVGDLYESTILQNSEQLNYWRPADETNIFGPNTNAYFPKPYAAAEANAKSRQTQTKYLLNAAYLRLKSIQIGYTFPKELSGKIKIQKLRVYLSGENLLILTKMPKVIDPELAFIGTDKTNGMSRVYPLSRVLSFGFNITF